MMTTKRIGLYCLQISISITISITITTYRDCIALV